MSILFLNGKIASLDSKDNFYEAIGIKNNIIDFLGTNEEGKSIEKDYDQVIDLNNKLVIPGFNDSHMHLLNYGYTLEKMDLTKYTSIEDMINGAKAFLEDKPSEFWLLGRGWNQDKFKEHRFVTREDLDKISEEVPIIFTRTCGHIAVCNSMALTYLNLKELRENPNVNLELGIFKEAASNILYAAIPSPTVAEIKKMITNTCKELLSYGITSVQSDDFDAMPDKNYENIIKAYKELLDEGKLKVRIYEQCLFPNMKIFQEFIDKGYKTGEGNNFFKIGPLKLLLDGALGGRTALLREPYSDDSSTCGIGVYTQEELDKYVKLAQDNNFQIAAHAIGDKAMDLYLNSLEKLGQHLEKYRHGIVHCQITTMDILERMKRLGVMAYIQPIFLDYDMHIVKERVGERAKESYIFKTMRNLGIKVSGGSDAPVVHFNPFENIYSAVCRKDLQGYPEGGYMPEEKMSVKDALKMFTIDSAYCSFEENIKGTLEIGKLADLVVLSEDIFNVKEDKIKDIEAILTMVNGEIVYEK